MERVMVEIANYLSKDDDIKVNLLVMSVESHHFDISDRVLIHSPKDNSKNHIIRFFKIFTHIRKKIKQIRPRAVLSFGSMYNSFVLLYP